MPLPATLTVPAVTLVPVAVKTLAATPVTVSLNVTVKVAGDAVPVPPVTATVGGVVSVGATARSISWMRLLL